jgi:aminoglycoside phosphotransferase (APT) family kinase protein
MLDPEALAREWVPGEGAPVVRLLSRGLAASTWRVRRDGRSFAMRVPLAAAPASATALAGDAASEISVFAAAAAAGLGPPVAAADPATGILVTGWTRGRSWSRATARDARQAPRIAALLRAIHALQPAVARRAVSPADWIRHYGAVNAAADSASLADHATRRLAALARLPPAARVLCHSDLHRQNLVETAGKLVVLDWEYAHQAEPFWDLAGWLSVNDLGAAPGQRLLAAYLGHPPAPQDLERLALLSWLYDYVCLLWSVANRGRFAAPVGAAVAKRGALLAARLQAFPR